MFEAAEKSRLRLLLDHFALVDNDWEGWRVAHPLSEVLLLVYAAQWRPATALRTSPTGARTI